MGRPKHQIWHNRKNIRQGVSTQLCHHCVQSNSFPIDPLFSRRIRCVRPNSTTTKIECVFLVQVEFSASTCQQNMHGDISVGDRTLEMCSGITLSHN